MSQPYSSSTASKGNIFASGNLRATPDFSNQVFDIGDSIGYTWKNAYFSGNVRSFLDATDSTDLVNKRQLGNILDSTLSNVDQHIVPITTEVYDLGDSTRKFRDLYLSGTSINLGNLVMSEHTGRVRFTNHTTGQEVKLAASNINQHLIDSTAILDIVDETFLDSQLQVLNYLDSAQINTRIDSFIDSAVFALIDSSFYIDSALAKQIFSVTGGV